MLLELYAGVDSLLADSSLPRYSLLTSRLLQNNIKGYSKIIIIRNFSRPQLLDISRQVRIFDAVAFLKDPHQACYRLGPLCSRSGSLTNN